jgi:tetratricopeptide (TPR) repeat protein
MIQQDNDTVYLVTGDKKLREYYGKTAVCVDTLAFLESCLTDFEADLVQGTIPMDYFITRTASVRREMEKYYKRNGVATTEVAYRESERLHTLGNELMYKRKFNEAILIFQLGLEKNPISPATYDSLGKAYRKIGNIDLAEKYARKSRELSDQGITPNNQ